MSIILENYLHYLAEGLMSFDGSIDTGTYKKDTEGEFWLISRKLGLVFAYYIKNPKALKKVGGTSDFYHTYKVKFVEKLRDKMQKKVKRARIFIKQPSYGKGESEIEFKDNRVMKSGAILDFKLRKGQIVKLATSWLLPFEKFKGTVKRIK